MKDYPHVLAQFYGTPWVITQAKFDEIEFALRTRIFENPALAQAALTPEAKRPKNTDIREVRGDVGVITIRGTLSPRPSMFSSGAANCTEIAESLNEHLGDKDVEAIVIDADSPGGQVFGIEELGDKIYEARKIKPIHCVANHMMCSGMMWLGSQCTSISAAPSAILGSIGVIMKHLSTAERDKATGVSWTTITAGRRKGESDPTRVLSDEARKSYESQCAAMYEKFVSAVARGRNVSKERVMSPEWGEGASVIAEDALKVGMIDRIATFENVVDMLRGKKPSKPKASQEDNARRLRALAIAEAKTRGVTLG